MLPHLYLLIFSADREAVNKTFSAAAGALFTFYAFLPQTHIIALIRFEHVTVTTTPYSYLDILYLCIKQFCLFNTLMLRVGREKIQPCKNTLHLSISPLLLFLFASSHQHVPSSSLLVSFPLFSSPLSSLLVSFPPISSPLSSQYWRSGGSVHCSGGPPCLSHYCVCPLLPLHRHQTQSS